jgi:hypothetical protein
MKVVSTEALTKLIQLIKSSFISVDDTEQTSEIETEIPSEVTLATVATTGDYDDLINKSGFMPDYSAGVSISVGSYTPPSDGLIRVEGGNNNNNKTITVNGSTAAQAWVASNTSTDICAWVQQGDSVSITGSGVGVYFYPLKGVNNA